MKLKRYVLFAGVNGAGKTTLYQTNTGLKTFPRVNVDEIVREFGSWNNPADMAVAGRKAVKLISRYFESGVSFNQETTLCGKSILRNIRKAKDQQYSVELYFVGLDTVELAKERVKQRVLSGGHGIPEKDIERRYYESLTNLKQVLPICDHVELFDNTESFSRVAIFEYGVCVDKTEKIPPWCEGLFNCYLWGRNGEGIS